MATITIGFGFNSYVKPVLPIWSASGTTTKAFADIRGGLSSNSSVLDGKYVLEGLGFTYGRSAFGETTVTGGVVSSFSYTSTNVGSVISVQGISALMAEAWTTAAVYAKGNDWFYGSANNDTFSTATGNDVALGGEGADSIYGGAGSDILFGQNGNDTLYGEADNDWLEGGDGDDRIYGDAGADILLGGAGGDTLIATSLSSDTTSESGALGFGNQLYGGIGADLLFGSGAADWIDCGFGDTSIDLAYGGDGNDVMTGNGGADFLYGENGNDLIVIGGGLGSAANGGAGNDELWGGNFADVLRGGLGADTLIGLGGKDLFAFYQEDLQAGVTDVILGFGDFGDDIDTISIQANLQASAISFSDGLYSYRGTTYSGAFVKINFGGATTADIFVLGVTSALVRGNVELSLSGTNPTVL